MEAERVGDESTGDGLGDKAVLEAVRTTSDGSLTIVPFVVLVEDVGTATSSSESDSSSHLPFDFALNAP